MFILKDRNMKKIKLDLESICSCGPFKIARSIDLLSYNDLKKFYNSLENPENQPILCELMFFQKYIQKINPEISKNIENIAIKNHKKHIENENNIPYSLSRFNEEEKNLIFRHLAYVQVTHGCGGDCVGGCGVDAIPKVRDRIPVNHILYTLKKVAENKDRKQFLKLFYASDTLEISDSYDNFFLIADNYYKLFKHPFEIVTSVPKGTEELYKKICQRKNKKMHICLSITEQNIKRLSENGILKPDKIYINDLSLNSGNNSYVSFEDFNEEYIPDEANKIEEKYRYNIGINRYKLKGRKFNFWNRVALIMTPYGILNTVCIPTINEDFPQGRIVTSIDKISDELIEEYNKEKIQPLLTRTVVRYSDFEYSTNRSVFLTNLVSNSRVLINEQGKIIYIEKLYKEPPFFDVKKM
ncbi:MAG: hypothetical protein QXW97_01140 [Candidatus Pacearchaeota archaeon]